MRLEAIIERYLEGWVRSDVAAIMDLYGDGFQYHDLTAGLVVPMEGIEAFLTETFAAEGRSPMSFHDTIIPNEETVFLHWTQMLKTPGKRGTVRIGGVELLIIRDEKIVSVYEFYDFRPPDPAERESQIDAAHAEQLRKLGLAEADVADIAARAGTYLTDQQAFLDPDISLSGVAEAIGVTRNQLSHVLNNVMAASFYDWVNGQRIAYVKSQMEAFGETDAKAFSVVNAAMDAGFNSISGFYTAFKKHAGVTPTVYLKKVMPSP